MKPLLIEDYYQIFLEKFGITEQEATIEEQENMRRLFYGSCSIMLTLFQQIDTTITRKEAKKYRAILIQEIDAFLILGAKGYSN